MKKIKNILILLSVILVCASCSKEYLETVPTTSLSGDQIFSTLSGAQTLLEGIHRATYQEEGSSRYGQKAVDHFLDCLSDDFYPLTRGYNWFVAEYTYISHRNAQGSYLLWVWGYYYDLINNANFLLKNLPDFKTISVSDENWRLNIMAQALTYRAHSLYTLVQLFGEGTKGVPVPIVPNPGSLARSTVDAVYTQILADLTLAEKHFTDGGSTRARANISHFNLKAIYAIRARIALTREDWSGASMYAALAKDGATLTPDYTYGWNKVNSEWLWGAVVISEQLTTYSSFFSHMDPYFGGYLSLGAHKMMSIEVYDFLDKGDARKVVNSPDIYHPDDFASKFASHKRSSFKYTVKGQVGTDYLYIKAGEMYLIEAEALYRQGDEAGARTAMNILNKARLYTSKYDDAYFDANIKIADNVTGEALFNTIIMFRRAELWGDGQRWLDLKRLNLPLIRDGEEQVLSPADINNIPAGDKRFTFLIPKQEMDANALMEQNAL